MKAVRHMNELLREQLAGRAGCSNLTLHTVLNVVSYATDIFDVEFVLNEGDPPRRFQVRFVSNLCDAERLALDGCVNVNNINQVTRYEVYEHCTPAGVHAM